MAEIECFMIEATDREWRWLRRFTFSPTKVKNDAGEIVEQPEGPAHRYCPVDENGRRAGHEATTFVGEGAAGALSTDDVPRDDPRWPDVCERCGGPFLDDDEWQVFRVHVWRDLRSGEEYANQFWSIHPNSRFGPQAPPGAMYYTPWLSPLADNPTPDGQVLAVQTPAGQWIIDWSSPSGGFWTRSGTPPKVTASPLIVVGEPARYHGWLRDGKLVDA